MSKYTDRSMDLGVFKEKKNDDLLICRCEEITQGEIRRAIHLGMWTMTEIKRFLRPGMGLCQGQSCARHVKRILAEELRLNPQEIKDVTARAPMRPITLETYGNEVSGDEY